MGETTVQPTNQAAEKKDRHGATWLAAASALTAVVAAVISGLQVNIANKTDTATKQQQLLGLTINIAQQFEQSRTSAITAQLEAEGEAGASIIKDLNGNGVASIEYIQVARALNDDGHGIDATTYYKKAVNAPPYDPETRATALRYLALFYYTLVQPVTAHRYAMQAVKVLNRSSHEARSYRANAIAQAYLLDADNQIYIKGGCPIAAREMVAAQKAIGRFSENAAVQEITIEARNGYKLNCKGGV